MNLQRCIGLLLVLVLTGCDADKAAAPAPKAAIQAPADAPASNKSPTAAPVVQGAEVVHEAPASVHQLTPNVSVVPVMVPSKSVAAESVAGKKPSAPAGTSAAAKAAPEAKAKAAKLKADNAEIAHRQPVANKTKPASQIVKTTRLPKASLDLSLPPDMVKQLAPPPGIITAAPKRKSPAVGAKPLLPKMFPETESDPDFQLQGRLLSNEMQLQLRNEARKDVEGAALDFTFKQ